MTFFALKRYNFLKLALQTLEQFPDFEQEMEEEKANMKQNVSQIKVSNLKQICHSVISDQQIFKQVFV